MTRRRLVLAGRIAFSAGLLATLIYAGSQHHIVEAVALFLLYVLWLLAWVV